MTSSSTPNQERARRTFDALSLFLVASMGTLLLMYLLDSGKQESFTSDQDRARALQQELSSTLPPTCSLESAGARGEVLLIHCPATPAPQLAQQIKLTMQSSSAPQLPSWVATLALRDTTQTLMCDRLATHCEPHPLPSSEELSASRRRPPR